MRVGELFAGYSGLGMGLKLVYPDAEVAWVSEIDPGACKVLAHRYPGAPNLGDITAIDWSQVEPVDVATAGFPCTDVSTAGKQAGLIHGTRSGLWHEVVRYAREHRPPLLILENVRGLLSARGDESEELDAAEDKVRRIDDTAARLTQMRDRAQKRGDREQVTSIDRRAVRLLVIRDRAVVARKRAERRVVRAIGTVVGTLADIGYDAVWCGLRAADVGGCHGRFRIFVAAYPADLGYQWAGRAWEWRAGPANGDLLPTPTTRDHKGHNQRRGDTCLTGALLPTPRATDGTHGGPNQRGSSGDLMLPSAVAKLLPTPRSQGAEDRNATLWVRSADQPQSLENAVAKLLPTPTTEPQTSWGDYAAAIARWERVLGRPAPDPTEISPKSMKGCPIHGDSTQTGPAEELPSVRAAATKEAVFERQARGPERFPEAESLLPGVREQSPDSHPISSPEASAESPPGSVPDVRGDGSATRPPRRPQLGQRRPEQPRDPVRLLSPETALAGGPGEAAGGQSVGAGCTCKRRLSPEFESWMMGLPDGWITDVPGVTWQEAVRMCGNGVMPQQAAAGITWCLSQIDALGGAA